MHVLTPPDISEAGAQIQKAAAAKKCWQCGCLHGTLAAIQREWPEGQRPAELDEAFREAKQRLAAVQYDCLGCAVCFPALAANALNLEGECATEPVEERAGWPPLPGAYTVLRYHAPVAICTLTDTRLAERLNHIAGSEVALVGSLFTENLGIERVISNVLANPFVRFLVVCGADSQQAIGHLPGQSLLALGPFGLDERGRIVNARGKRPIVRNLPREAVEHFRRTVELVDRVGMEDENEILTTVRECARRNPGPAEPFLLDRVVKPVPGYIPERMLADPQGYFVVYVDSVRSRLSLEHYGKDSVLDSVIEGACAAELYTPAMERGLVSRLDHAAYLGRELARAEHALLTGGLYVQDAAPERAMPPPEAPCGCGSACKETSP